MTTRALQPSDIPILTKLSAESGFPYIDLRGPHIEAVQVIQDDKGKIIAAAAAHRITELYLWMGESDPMVKLHALRMLHCSMAEELRKLGYQESNTFLAPNLVKSFGRRLMRTFGWQRNWDSFCVRF